MSKRSLCAGLAAVALATGVTLAGSHEMPKDVSPEGGIEVKTKDLKAQAKDLKAQTKDLKAQAKDEAKAFMDKMKDAPVPAEVGKTVPDFTLTDTEGNEHSLHNYLASGKRVVLEWFNPDCPFVKKHHVNNKSMAETFTVASDLDVVWLAVNSGGPGKQGYGVERNVKAREEYELSYPVLMDETGAVGKLFGAKTTPHMFIIENDGTLIYNGAIDDKPNPSELGKTNYVIKALGQCAEGKKISDNSTKPYGCSVKYAS